MCCVLWRKWPKESQKSLMVAAEYNSASFYMYFCKSYCSFILTFSHLFSGRLGASLSQGSHFHPQHLKPNLATMDRGPNQVGTTCSFPMTWGPRHYKRTTKTCSDQKVYDFNKYVNKHLTSRTSSTFTGFADNGFIIVLSLHWPWIRRLMCIVTDCMNDLTSKLFPASLTLILLTNHSCFFSSIYLPNLWFSIESSLLPMPTRMTSCSHYVSASKM